MFAEGNSEARRSGSKRRWRGGEEAKKEKKKKKEMKDNEEEEGQPEGAPDLPNVSRLFGDKTWLYSRFPEEHSERTAGAAARRESRELLARLRHAAAALAPPASCSIAAAARMFSLEEAAAQGQAVLRGGWGATDRAPPGSLFCWVTVLASLVPPSHAQAVTELCCVSLPIPFPKAHVLEALATWPPSKGAS